MHGAAFAKKPLNVPKYDHYMAMYAHRLAEMHKNSPEKFTPASDLGALQITLRPL